MIVVKGSSEKVDENEEDKEGSFWFGSEEWMDDLLLLAISELPTWGKPWSSA